MNRLGIVLVLVGLLWGCAGAPVQEMSDARQAIQAAREAGADQHDPGQLAGAEELLEMAEQSLEVGAYRAARRDALAAKAMAIEALEKTAAAKHGENGTIKPKGGE